jgi:hypothetical protein
MFLKPKKHLAVLSFFRLVHNAEETTQIDLRTNNVRQSGCLPKPYTQAYHVLSLLRLFV